MTTKTQPKHTHLQVLDGYEPPIIGWDRGDGDHHVAEIIAQPDDADTDRFAARLVACWNACEGINPEAVPELLAACKAFQHYWKVCLSVWEQNNGRVGEATTGGAVVIGYDLDVLSNNAAIMADAAIAKAEGQEGGGA